jgi:hypothetical protein
MSLLSDFLEGHATAEREEYERALKQIRADADKAYKAMARQAADLLGAAQAAGAAAIFEEAADRGLYE